MFILPKGILYNMVSHYNQSQHISKEKVDLLVLQTRFAISKLNATDICYTGVTQHNLEVTDISGQLTATRVHGTVLE